MCDEADSRVVCRICGKKLKSMSTRHIQTHGITSAMYKEMFPDSVQEFIDAGTFKKGFSGFYKGKTWADVIGKEKAEAQKKLFREIAAERYANGILSPKISRPHKALMALLSLYNIQYECEYHIDYLAADIAILDKKIVIEIDGIYFHNKTGLSWEELDETQRKVQQNDKNKEKVFKDAGWTVLRFWEDAIYDDRMNVLNSIFSALDMEHIAFEDFPYVEGDLFCKHCGKFMTYKQKLGKSKYCSKECRKADRQPPPPRSLICKHCGKQFFVERDAYPRVFCSKECFRIGRDANTSEEVKEKLRITSTNSTYNKKRREEGRVHFICPCGKEAWKPKCHARGMMLYCSGDCYHKYAFKYKGQTNNPLYEENKCQNQ